MKSRHLILFGSVIMALFLLTLTLSATGASLASIEPPAGPDSPPITLNISQPAFPELDPALANDVDSGNIVEQLFVSLTDVDDETGLVFPELATSWTISVDQLAYTFTLRGGATWSDGSPVTAGDVRYGILRSLGMGPGANTAYTLQVIENAQEYYEGNISDPNLVGVQALNPTTLRIDLREPAAHLPAILAGWVASPMPQWAIDAHGADWTLPGNIVTSGAYEFAESLPDDVLVLRKNPDHFAAGDVQIEQVNLWVRNANTAWQMYLDGELDTAAVPDGVEVDPAMEPEISWRSRPGTDYLGFSVSQPPFDNVLVRKAFSAAIDRVTLNDAYTITTRQPALTFTPPDVLGHVDGYAQGVGLPYNPSQAQQWLADAGYPGGAGLPPITLWFNLGRYDYDYYQAIVDGWNSTLGVSVTVQTLPWPEYLDFTNSGAAQVWRLGWLADYLEAHNFLADAVYNNTGRSGGWSDGAYDSLIDLAANEPNPAARAALYEQAEEILVETEAVMAPVYYFGNRVASKSYLQRTLPPMQFDLANWRVLTDTTVVDAGGGLLASSDGRVAIEVPPGGVADPTQLTLFPISWTPPPAALAKVGQAYGLHAHTLAGDPAGPPVAPYLMHITYSDDEISGLDEAGVALYSWDGAQWQREASSVDAGTNTVSAAVDHFSLFALMAAPDPLPVRLDMNLQFVPAAPDPALVSDQQSVNLVEQLFLGLVAEDDETGVILPELATSWDISADSLVYTFTLRSDAYWSDGNPVTADDARYGILRSLDPATNAPFAFMLYAIENGEEYHNEVITDPDLVGVEALDATTLRVSLAGPAAHVLHILAMPMARPMPQWAIDAYGEAWTEPGNIVSNGPFIFAETLPDDRLRLEKNPAYYDAGNVQIEEVIMWSVGGAADSLSWYQQGRLDTTPLNEDVPLDPESAQEFRGDPRACTYYYGFSTSQQPFDNALVRKAFSAAIDRLGLLNDLDYSEAPAVTFTPHGVFGHVDGYAKGVGLPYNASQAQGWLADAGYPGGAGLPPITLWFNEGAGHEVVAEQARTSWYNTLGVSVTLQSLPWADFLDFTDTGAAQMWRLGWCADYLEAQNFLSNSVSMNYNRLGGWSNASYDNLLNQALAEPDEAARQDLYRQAEEILVETDAVLAPIYYYVTDRVTRPYLERSYPVGAINIAPWRTSKVRAAVGPEGGVLVAYDNMVMVAIPAGAFADTVILSQAPATGMPPDPGQTIIGPVFSVAASYGASGLPAAPAMPYTLTAEYDEANLSGADESLLSLYYWDGAQWLPEASSVVDPGNNTITAMPGHFSRWAVMAEAGLISGSISLQGRSDHSGAEACAWAGAVQVDCDTTDAAGDYALAIPGGEHTITIEMDRYLDAEKTFNFASGEIRALGDVTLRGGDANDSDTVNILDLSLMGAHFGLTCTDPSWDDRADINGDCEVNILDLSIAGGNYQASSPAPWVTWDFHTIPGLPANGSPRLMAALAPDDLYVWVEVSNADPLIRTAVLYHWDGAAWNQELAYPGYNYGRIQANASDDIFVSVSCPDSGGSCAGYETPHLAHFDGESWQEQTLPPETGAYVRDIGGAPGEVQATTTGSGNDIIIRYDETNETWSHLFTTPENTKALAFISADEAYYTGCWGHGRWNGSTWEWQHDFDFCDISDLWGMRDGEGALHLYTVGNNNFSNGIRVWKYDENANPALLGDFGSKCGYVFGDPDDGGFICGGVQAIGSASGVWGSAADDVYVVGRLGGGTDPDAGRIYRYNGTSWAQLTEMGDIAAVMDVQGSGAHDVWFSLRDGRLLHYGQ